MQRSFLCQWDRTRPPRVVLPFFLYCDGLTQFSYQEIFCSLRIEHVVSRALLWDLLCNMHIVNTVFVKNLCWDFFRILQLLNLFGLCECDIGVRTVFGYMVCRSFPTGFYVSYAERRWNMLSHVVVARLLCRLVVLLCMDTGPSMLLCRLVVLSLYGHWTFYAVRWFS